MKTTKIDNSAKKGHSMKRTGLVLLLAGVVVLAFATAALAATDAANTWRAWNSGGPNATSLPTPHTDYQLTTVKCATCHSVHKANATGEVLLRGSVADACTYCHITPGVSSVIVYDGTEAWYTDDVTYNHSSGGGATCNGCHAVHGANTVGSIGSVQQKILRAGTYQAGLPYTVNSATRDAAISAWCTQCHPYFEGDFDNGPQTKHIMTDTVSADYAGNSPDTPAGTFSGQVAWTADYYCRSCHDSGGDNGSGTQADNFPHYTDGMRFLMAAEYEGATSYDATTSAGQDGVCLKCHRDSPSAGAGITY